MSSAEIGLQGNRSPLEDPRSRGPDPTLPTELPNPLSSGIDVKTSAEIVEIIHRDDLRAWEAVGQALEPLAEVVDHVVDALRSGGRLIYVGAGTSGRLGVLDAAECPPTFGVEGRVRGIIAGGEAALRVSVEGAEDASDEGAAEMRRAGVRARDVVCGIAASGTTPFVWGALAEAALRDATTVLITSNPRWETDGRGSMIDLAIVIPVGPEIIAGSSRMKAGTATKLVLNTISTASMIRWGKVYDNLMVDLTPSNRKLERRAVGLISRIADVDLVRAKDLLLEAEGDVKAAIIIGKKNVDARSARDLLSRHGGVLREALEDGSAAGPPPRGSPPVGS
jgi:N-acetylmuramic acid 6-phosphate etherase